jgi:putative ABC transport system permease protein
VSSALRQDLRYAVRLLAKERGFTTIALLILALTIGSTVSMFSLVDAVLLRPLPFPNADRVVVMWESNPTAKLDRFPVSGPNFLDWRAQAASAFDAMAAFETREANIASGGEPERALITSASPAVFQVLGVRMARGRAFETREEDPGAPRVAVVSDEYWRTRLGADANVVGRTIRVDAVDYTIVGVAPPNTTLAEGTALYTVLVRGGAFDADQRGSHGFNVVAHLRPDVTIEQSRRVMATLADRLASTYPGSNRDWTVRLVSLRDELVGDVKAPLVAAFAAVVALLLIGCANIANLLSARATARRKEVLIRVALGADRSRLVQQLLTESVMLALVGGCLGIGVAWEGTRTLSEWAPQIASAYSTERPGMSLPVVTFAVAISVVTGIFFGLTPALPSARADAAQALRESSRGLTESRRLRRLRGALTVSQVALSVTLLSAAGLLVKSFERLQHEDVGFRTSGRVAMDIAPAGPAYASDSARARAYREIRARVAAVAGVRNAALVRALPLEPELTALNSFGVEGRPDLSSRKLPSAYQRPVTPGYLDIMGIPLLRGRTFTAADDERAPLVAIIDSAAAKKYWPGVDPVGHRLYYDRRVGRLWVTIVGVAGSVRHSLTSTEAEPTIYVPVSQWPMSEMTIVVQTALAPNAVVPAVSRAIQSFDPELPIARPRTLDRIAADATWRARFAATLLGAFATAALLLATLGIYGVMSYTVSQRRREMALRMALGARAIGIAKMIVTRSVLLGGAGIVIGLSVAAAGARVIAGLLYGSPALDIEVFASVALALLAISGLAGAWPAFRASHVPLDEVLRAD